MLTIEDIKDNKNGSVLLYRAIRGSHAFGLATEKSDIDEIWVYLAPISQLVTLGRDYLPILENETHDIVVYELNRFVELLDKSNPNILEALFIPDDCVLYVHPLFRKLIDLRENFLSKSAFKPYVGYAKNQIDKAHGLKKMISIDPVQKRLTVLDFLYVPYNQGSTKIINWLEFRNLSQRYCAATNVPNMFNNVNVYYDWGQHFRDEGVTFDDIRKSWMNNLSNEYKSPVEIIHDLKENSDSYTEEEIAEKKGQIAKMQFDNMVVFICDHFNLNCREDLLEWYESHTIPIGYRGLMREDEMSNELRLQSIPKCENKIIIGSYNKDAYSTHCVDYKRYHDWLKNRNEERFRVNTAHGKNYDSKNMYSCCRIMLTALELAKTGKFVLRRPQDRDFLLSVKKGEPSYDEIIKFADNLNEQMKEAMKTSELRETVDSSIIDSYLEEVRMIQIREMNVN